MGAGSIGTVPTSVMQRAKKSDLLVELKKIKDKPKKKETPKVKEKSAAKGSSKLVLVGQEESAHHLKKLKVQKLSKATKTVKAHKASKGRKGVGT